MSASSEAQAPSSQPNYPSSVYSLSYLSLSSNTGARTDGRDRLIGGATSLDGRKNVDEKAQGKSSGIGAYQPAERNGESPKLGK